MKQFAIALVLVLSAASGFSQCKANRVSARQEMRASTAVIVGTVIAIEPVAESWDFLDGVNYIVRVDGVIHGKATRDEYRIFSENVPAAFDMSVGKHYVLYVQPQYDRYLVNSCGNSHQTEELEASNRPLAKGE
ncbi:MAG TPA: hypothetical protein VGR96_09425 [Acidobacteriaceae bacterium]|nr:hypothetical protein [Acidobacteriaceae bacterium]